MNEAQPNLFGVGPRFAGVTVEAQDVPRLTTQYQKVFDLMKDGNWRSLAFIAEQCHCSQTSASARLRDFRKDWAGGHTVERKRIVGGMFLYRLMLNLP